MHLLPGFWSPPEPRPADDRTTTMAPRRSTPPPRGWKLEHGRHAEAERANLHPHLTAAGNSPVLARRSKINGDRHITTTPARRDSSAEIPQARRIGCAPDITEALLPT